MNKLKPARRELLSSEAYHAANLRMDLFAEVRDYLEAQGMSRKAFADRLGVTKSYVSQIMNGDADLKVSKLAELSLAIGKVPVVSFVDLEDFLKADGMVEGASPVVGVPTDGVAGPLVQAPADEHKVVRAGSRATNLPAPLSGVKI